MKVIEVATDDSRAYYEILSRLKKTHFRFVGISPSNLSASPDELIITTRAESSQIKGTTLAIEDLSEDPLVMEGQILSRIITDEPRRTLLIGVDPGSRTGVTIFFGGRQLGSFTVNSVDLLVDTLSIVVKGVPNSGVLVKIGDGDPKSSLRSALALREALPYSSIEIVDEKGTSTSRRSGVGIMRDQKAATKIAFRRGVPFDGVHLRRKSR